MFYKEFNMSDNELIRQDQYNREKKFFECLIDSKTRYTETYNLCNLLEITFRELLSEDMLVIFMAEKNHEISREDAMFMASIQSIKILNGNIQVENIPLQGITQEGNRFDFSPVSQLQPKDRLSDGPKTIFPYLFHFIVFTFLTKLQLLLEAQQLYKKFMATVDALYDAARKPDFFLRHTSQCT